MTPQGLGTPSGKSTRVDAPRNDPKAGAGSLVNFPVDRLTARAEPERPAGNWATWCAPAVHVGTVESMEKSSTDTRRSSTTATPPMAWLVTAAAMVVLTVLAYQGRPEAPAAQAIVPAASTAVAAPMFGPDAVDMATRILTEPDNGGGGYTMRWDRQQVTYSIAGEFPDHFLATIDRAFQWGSAFTGVDAVNHNGPDADIVITRGSGQGAYAEVWHRNGTIERATIELGCCWARAAYEDVLHTFGPLGDHGDHRSVFSSDPERMMPSAFDAWVLTTLYTLPPGTPPEDVRAALAASLPPL